MKRTLKALSVGLLMSSHIVLGGKKEVLKPIAPKHNPSQQLHGSLKVEQKIVLDKERRAQEFKEYLNENRRNFSNLPDAQEVDISFDIINHSSEPVVLRPDSDDEYLDLFVEGPGVTSVSQPLRGMHLAFTVGEEIEVPPGGLYTAKLNRLEFGRPGLKRKVFLTEPGTYTVSSIYYRPGDLGSVISQPVELTVV